MQRILVTVIVDMDHLTICPSCLFLFWLYSGEFFFMNKVFHTALDDS